jgi:hypothetical protein
MSSSYHPQTDGQTERFNQCLEAFLRCTVHSCPKQWSKWLSLAEFWYNTMYESALSHTPFEVLYGHPPRHFGHRKPQFKLCAEFGIVAERQGLSHSTHSATAS